MSKKLMKETAESIDEIPAELGPALKMLGTVLQEEWMARDGVYLPEDERKQNPEPIAFVEDSVISIRVGDKRITLRPSDSDKPALVIPVGMSDKKNTCSIPRDWLTGVWIDALIAAFDGDPSVALQFAARVNEAIDLAMITGEDGRQTVKQADLPSHRHAVEVAEITESLKRHFHGKSAGSPKVNMDFTIETIGSDHSTEMHKDPNLYLNIQHARQERENNVLNTLVPNPNVAQATPPLREVAVQEGSVVEASHPENTPLPVPATLEEDTVEHGASGESQAESEPIPEYTDSTDGPVELGITGEPLDVEMIILRAINNCGETDGATWGLIKKTAKADGSCDDLTPHRKVLDKLVKAGAVNKEGARRSTRYFLTGAGLEGVVGMPLHDVMHNELERTSMLPSGGSNIAIAKEPFEVPTIGTVVVGVSKVNQPEDDVIIASQIEDLATHYADLAEEEAQRALDGLPDGEEPNTSGEPEYSMTEEEYIEDAIASAEEGHLDHLVGAEMAEEGGMRMLTHQPSPEEIEASIDQMFTFDLDREGVCANSGLPATFVVEDLPVGPRAFATEKDYCEYAGLEYNGEGYYGFTEPPLEGDVDSEPVADAVSEAQEGNTPVEEQPSNDALGFGGY